MVGNGGQAVNVDRDREAGGGAVVPGGASRAQVGRVAEAGALAAAQAGAGGRVGQVEREGAAAAAGAEEPSAAVQGARSGGRSAGVSRPEQGEGQRDEVSSTQRLTWELEVLRWDGGGRQRTGCGREGEGKRARTKEDGGAARGGEIAGAKIGSGDDDRDGTGKRARRHKGRITRDGGKNCIDTAGEGALCWWHSEAAERGRRERWQCLR